VLAVNETFRKFWAMFEGRLHPAGSAVARRLLQKIAQYFVSKAAKSLC
jgi:hypothetical protein